MAVESGASVTIYEQKPSVGRKFLVAGKSGLNLTNDIEFDSFLSKYSGEGFPAAQWGQWLEAFDADALREWALGLGVETFAASGGKVFPSSKKAAPLLRRWVLKLKTQGVKFAVHHRWTGIEAHGAGWELRFDTRGQEVLYTHDSAVLAMGGGSWPQTGSDGAWVHILDSMGVALQPLQSANCGWECEWSEATRAVAEGQPIHHLEIRAGEALARGELMVTRYGFEGAPIYHLWRALRAMEEPELMIDFKPMFTLEHMVKKMESARRNFYKEAQLRWKFTEPMCAILRQVYGEFDSAEALAKAAKACRIRLIGPRPIEEVISSAGGVAWSELDENLMIRKLPGVYCAGEMIDWEAPTGGFLIQGCFLTGAVAGRAASVR